MTAIVRKTNYTSDSNTFVLTNGAQAGRAVVVVASQRRTPADMNSATFDSAVGTDIEVGRHSTDSQLGTLIAYRADADLPASAGTFNVTVNSERHTVFEMSGWNGEARNFQESAN